MSLNRLPSGRWRARVYHQGKDLNVGHVLGLPAGTTWRTKAEAKAAREDARRMLRSRGPASMTVGEFWERWTTDPIFSRPKESTNIHNRERTKGFADRYGSLLLSQVGDLIVAEWIAGGRRRGTVPALRAMFNDAASPKAGRLIASNPFAGLGLSRGRGNRDATPPSQETAWALIIAARKLTSPSFAAWLQVAAFTGLRPGELDALRWDAIDLDRNRILVAEQFSAASRTFTLPKNGRRREAPLTEPAREALLGLARESEFCFTNLRGQHWTGPARAYHWKAVRASVGFEGSLYVATRHHAGWYMVNVLGLASEDVAIALGHEDGGQLTRILYGHRDRDAALNRVLKAYEGSGNVLPFPRRMEDSA